MKICYVFLGTFVGQFNVNVLRLIKVFTVTDLPTNAFFMFVYVCQNLWNLPCIYIYIYIY